MTEEERVALAVSVLNHTLGMDDLPISIMNRLSTAVILLDPYEEDDIDQAITDAYEALEQDNYIITLSVH